MKNIESQNAEVNNKCKNEEILSDCYGGHRNESQHFNLFVREWHKYNKENNIYNKQWLYLAEEKHIYMQSMCM